jgi:hypothetical protein
MAAAIVAAVAWHASRPDPAPSEPPPPEDSATECLDTGTLHSVRAINRFDTRVRGDDAFAGGDVGASVRLSDGRYLFVFGDTLRAPDYVGERFVRNSMLLFSPGCSRVVLPDDGGAVIPDRADGVGYWPMSVALQHRDGVDRVGIGVQRVRSTGEGIFDFDILGPALAVFDVAPGGTPQLRRLVDIGPDRADPSRPMWGSAVAVEHGWAYVYGTARPTDATTGGFSLRVARARMTPRSLTDTGRWQYWTGSTWSRKEQQAAVLIPSQGGVSQTLSVFPRGKEWFAISKKDEVLGTDLTIWRAPAPTGPFVAEPAAARIPSDAVTGTLRYLPLAHPDLLPRRGTVVVSYSENNTDFAVVSEDPRRYRPRFLRIPLD